jgi:hypothetical protein
MNVRIKPGDRILVPEENPRASGGGFLSKIGSMAPLAGLLLGGF